MDINFFQDWFNLSTFDENEGKVDEIKNQRKIRSERNWGLPTFKDQIDKGLTYYDLIIDYHPKEPLIVRSHLEFRKNSTGSDIWDCTLVLAHFFAIHSTVIQDAVVLELGSGVGALGMMLFKLGASKVYLTDMEPNGHLIRQNVAQNFSSSGSNLDSSFRDRSNMFYGIAVKTLYWGTTYFDDFFSSDEDENSATISKDMLFNGKRLVIVGSDLFLPFAPHLLKPLCESIAALLTFSSLNKNPSSPFVSAEAFLAYEERFDCSLFYTYANELNIEVQTISNDELHPLYQDPGIIFVLRLTLKDV